MKKFKVVLMGLLALTFSVSIGAEVLVATRMKSDKETKNVVVNAGQYLAIPLNRSGGSNDKYVISVNTSNEVFRDLTAFVVDEENLVAFRDGYRFKGAGYSKAETPFLIEATIPNTGNRYLLLDNKYAQFIKKKVSVEIEAEYEISAQQQDVIKNIFSKFYGGLKKNYIFPDFNVHVEPCGKANASSDASKSGDIYFCSELIDQLFRSRNEKAILPIFLHEAGHSLLGLWGIPGYNNEDIADEFSTYILMSGGPDGYQYLRASLEFWRGRDSFREAANMLENGDRHSLSVQRLRNIEENMVAGEAFIKRWNKLLYEHHTDSALNDVIKNPQPGANVELATTVLKQRLVFAQ